MFEWRKIYCISVDNIHTFRVITLISLYFERDLMLRSKPILAEKLPDDGRRISIMSRHTKSDGVTPDERLTEDLYDEHRPELAAPARLVGWYYRGEVSFDEYAKLYINHLETDVSPAVEKLIQEAQIETITVMCIEDEPYLCHRRLLLEYAQELSQTLWEPLQIDVQ